MYLVHEGIQKDQGSDWGLDQDLEGTREPTGLGLNIDFESNTNRRNRLNIDTIEATECIKSWNKLKEFDTVPWFL